MPELPEVETVKRRLNQVVAGKTIEDIQVLRKKSFSGQIESILNSKITAIKRQAKLIRFCLDNDKNLLVHLKMTGQLIYVSDEERIGGGHPTSDWIDQLPGKHTRIIFTFADESHLYFNDMRVFGWIRVLTDEQVEAEFDKYGPDANTDDFTTKYLQKALSNRTIPIKQAILIGKIVGGIGNIYACEALFEAGIDPRRPANQLSDQEYERLVLAIKKVLQQGIKSGGTTFDGSYVNVDGLSGNYQEKLKVYGREDEGCLRCSGKVKKIKISGRGTYFCPSCQK